MRTIIEFNEVVQGLNGSGGLIREHFRYAKVRKYRYHKICIQQRKVKHDGAVNVYFYRYTVTLMDWDNMCASFKHIGDALVTAGIIKDDKPSIIVNFIPKQIKVAHKKEQKSVVVIEDYV